MRRLRYLTINCNRIHKASKIDKKNCRQNKQESTKRAITKRQILDISIIYIDSFQI